MDVFLKLCESLTVVHIYLCSFSGYELSLILHLPFTVAADRYHQYTGRPQCTDRPQNTGRPQCADRPQNR